MTREIDHRYSMEGNYVVRLYDGFDNRWMDISSKDLSLPEAAKLWDEKTNGGKELSKYEHIDYYDIFPGDTTMMYSYEALGEPS